MAIATDSWMSETMNRQSSPFILGTTLFYQKITLYFLGSIMAQFSSFLPLILLQQGNIAWSN